ncbi:MAG: methyltransferase domain-containing protein [candidate division Zixibacteria bacterium]|nr:methyltransferase domain-containing protein [candidate division Zixibacteria bacterium]
MNSENPYDRKYAGEEYYWGKTPSSMCAKVLEFADAVGSKCPKLIDLGSGEGRDAVHFAQHGFDVTALELSPVGVEKTIRLAVDSGVSVTAIQGDIFTCELQNNHYDVIFSTGTLHYLPPDIRRDRFDHFKNATVPGGINAQMVFVEKPFVEKAPDAEEKRYLFRSGELMSYYWDWEILFSVEEIFDCQLGDIPHRHACNRIVARKS